MTDIQQNAAARAAADKKYVKVVPIDPAKIVDEEGNAIDLKDTKLLSDWLVQAYKGKEVEVKDDGRTVVFFRKGLEASTKRRGEAQRQMYADLEFLIENGVYVGYALGDSNHLHVERQNIYYAAAKINENVYGVRFKVDIFKGGSKKGSYKDHKIVELAIEKSPLLCARSGDYSSPSLYRSRPNGVASQNKDDFFIAIPNIRQAFDNKDTTIILKSQEKHKKTSP